MYRLRSRSSRTATARPLANHSGAPPRHSVRRHAFVRGHGLEVGAVPQQNIFLNRVYAYFVASWGVRAPGLTPTRQCWGKGVQSTGTKIGGPLRLLARPPVLAGVATSAATSPSPSRGCLGVGVAATRGPQKVRFGPRCTQNVIVFSQRLVGVLGQTKFQFR